MTAKKVDAHAVAETGYRWRDWLRSHSCKGHCGAKTANGGGYCNQCLPAHEARIRAGAVVLEDRHLVRSARTHGTKPIGRKSKTRSRRR